MGWCVSTKEQVADVMPVLPVGCPWGQFRAPRGPSLQAVWIADEQATIQVVTPTGMDMSRVLEQWHLQVPTGDAVEVMPILMSQTDDQLTQSNDAYFHALRLPKLRPWSREDGADPDILCVVGPKQYYLLDRASSYFLHHLHACVDLELGPRQVDRAVMLTRLNGLPVLEFCQFRGTLALQNIHDLDPGYTPCFLPELLSQVQVISIAGPVQVRFQGSEAAVIREALPVQRFQAFGWQPVWTAYHRQHQTAVLQFNATPDRLYLPECDLLQALAEVLVQGCLQQCSLFCPRSKNALHVRVQCSGRTLLCLIGGTRPCCVSAMPVSCPVRS